TRTSSACAIAVVVGWIRRLALRPPDRVELIARSRESAPPRSGVTGGRDLRRGERLPLASRRPETEVGICRTFLNQQQAGLLPVLLPEIRRHAPTKTTDLAICR